MVLQSWSGGRGTVKVAVAQLAAQHESACERGTVDVAQLMLTSDHSTVDAAQHMPAWDRSTVSGTAPDS